MLRSREQNKSMTHDTPQDPRNETLMRSLETNNIPYELDESGNVKATRQVVSFLESKEALHDPDKPVVVKTKQELLSPEAPEAPEEPRPRPHMGGRGVRPQRAHLAQRARAGKKIFLLNIITEEGVEDRTIAVQAANVDEAKGVAQLKHQKEFPEVNIEDIEVHNEPSNESGGNA